MNNHTQFTFQSDSLEKANLKARSLPRVRTLILNRNSIFLTENQRT